MSAEKSKLREMAPEDAPAYMTNTEAAVWGYNQGVRDALAVAIDEMYRRNHYDETPEAVLQRISTDFENS